VEEENKNFEEAKILRKKQRVCFTNYRHVTYDIYHTSKIILGTNGSLSRFNGRTFIRETKKNACHRGKKEFVLDINCGDNNSQLIKMAINCSHKCPLIL